MRNSFIIPLTATFILLGSLFFQSCRKNFDINELKNSNLEDSLQFNGSVAVPLVNTQLSLGNFIPKTDSTLWAEVDTSGLIHLRMYYKDLAVMEMNQVYPLMVYPTPSGTSIPPGEKVIKTDTTKMKVYSKMLSGHLFFNDPRITFKITNEIPVVSFFKLDTIIFYDIDNNAISHTSNDKYTINAPTATGTSAQTDIFIDKTVIPQLPDVFSPVPSSISFVVTAGSDVTQNLPYSTLGSEKMKADVDLDLPLDARLVDLVMGDTIPFGINAGNYDQIESATLKIRFNNGFPVEGRTQIYFADTTATGEPGNIVDSVFTDITEPDIFDDGWRFVSAQTDAIGLVTLSQESNIVITLDQARFQKLKDLHVAKMIITSKLNSFQSTTTFVKLMSDYKLGVKISLKADFSVNSNGGF